MKNNELLHKHTTGDAIEKISLKEISETILVSILGCADDSKYGGEYPEHDDKLKSPSYKANIKKVIDGKTIIDGKINVVSATIVCNQKDCTNMHLFNMSASNILGVVWKLDNPNLDVIAATRMDMKVSLGLKIQNENIVASDLLQDSRKFIGSNINIAYNLKGSVKEQLEHIHLKTHGISSKDAFFNTPPHFKMWNEVLLKEENLKPDGYLLAPSTYTQKNDTIAKIQWSEQYIERALISLSYNYVASREWPDIYYRSINNHKIYKIENPEEFIACILKLPCDNEGESDDEFDRMLRDALKIPNQYQFVGTYKDLFNHLEHKASGKDFPFYEPIDTQAKVEEIQYYQPYKGIKPAIKKLEMTQKHDHNGDVDTKYDNTNTTDDHHIQGLDLLGWPTNNEQSNELEL